MTSARLQKAWVRPVRLWCGFILLAYLVTHFSNHALGLVSLAAMEQGRLWFLALWRNPLGETALFGALLTHWFLGLWLIYRRRTLRMPAWEATQILFGLAVPPLLAYHFAGTRLANAMYGTQDLYARALLNYWVQDYWAGARQAALFCIAWIHGCIGLHFWLRVRPWYPRAFPALLTSFVLLPVLAFLGVAEAGREVTALARDPEFAKRLLAETRSPVGAQRAELTGIRDLLLWTTWALLGLTLAARGVRDWVLRRFQVRIRYFDGKEVQIPAGWSVLDASRHAGIPHASVCGGRGRCSTCRIRVAGDPATLPPPAPLERRVLERIGAPPNVRLACQLRPTADVLVTPLLPPTVRVHAAHAVTSSRSGGHEREIAVLFADLREFTRLAENKLPYDVVFILNRYFEAVGSAVALAGGVANQYTGDGVMALFGIESEPEVACRQALVAAGAMVHRVSELGRALGGELKSPFRIGIGIHAGPVVVGEMGYGETRYLTAVGDTVNTAARLEGLTKEHDCELVVSEHVLERAGVDPGNSPRADLALRNREATLRVVLVDNAERLAVRAAALSSRIPDPGGPFSAASPATQAAPPPRA
jgi:adenylate cyclase